MFQVRLLIAEAGLLSVVDIVAGYSYDYYCDYC